jgi:hypothetical protein
MRRMRKPLRLERRQRVSQKTSHMGTETQGSSTRTASLGGLPPRLSRVLCGDRRAVTVAALRNWHVHDRPCEPLSYSSAGKPGSGTNSRYWLGSYIHTSHFRSQPGSLFHLTATQVLGVIVVK